MGKKGALLTAAFFIVIVLLGLAMTYLLPYLVD